MTGVAPWVFDLYQIATQLACARYTLDQIFITRSCNWSASGLTFVPFRLFSAELGTNGVYREQQNLIYGRKVERILQRERCLGGEFVHEKESSL